jgi:peroxiredoxin
MTNNHEEEWVSLIPDGPFELAEELDRWRRLREVAVPADVLARMDRANRELAVSHSAGRVAQIGSPAPGFTLPNAIEKLVSLDQLLDDGPVVISFYRGIWCPFCNLEQRALQQCLPQITELGGSLVAISGMTADNSLSMADRLGLTYEVLTDAGLGVARSYGLVFDLPEYLQTAYEESGHPVPQFNGTADHALPIPGTFVIDSSGVIRFSYANPNYMHRADPADIVATLQTLS